MHASRSRSEKGSLCYEHMMVVETFVSRCREMEMSAIVYSFYLALSYVILLLWYCPIFSLFMSWSYFLFTCWKITGLTRLMSDPFPFAFFSSVPPPQVRREGILQLSADLFKLEESRCIAWILFSWAMAVVTLLLGIYAALLLFYAALCTWRFKSRQMFCCNNLEVGFWDNACSVLTEPRYLWNDFSFPLFICLSCKLSISFT